MEVVRTFNSTEEYIKFINQSKVDEVYKEAVDNAIGNKVNEELINEAITELADAEAELGILEDLFLNDKVSQKELTNAKRRHTKAKKNLDRLIEEENSNGN